MASPGNQHCANRIGTLSFPMGTWGQIYKISYDSSSDYLQFIVRSTHDSDLKRTKISLRNIVS